jgi:hypothetical protein
MHAPRLLFAAILVGIVNFGMPVPASAGRIALTGTPGDWVVDFDSSVVSLFWDTATRTNGTQGSLNEITNRSNSGQIVLTFRQMTASTEDSPARGGLRVNFQKDDPNITGPDWKNYQLKLIDVIPGKNVVFADHPPQPHFHPLRPIATTPSTFIVGSKTFSGGDTNKYMSSFLGSSAADDRTYPDTILFTDVIKKGESLGIRNLLLHERLFFGGQNAAMKKRVFQLVEFANVPEPNTLYGLGIGLAVIAYFARRRRRRADRGAVVSI